MHRFISTNRHKRRRFGERRHGRDHREDGQRAPRQDRPGHDGVQEGPPGSRRRHGEGDRVLPQEGREGVARRAHRQRRPRRRRRRPTTARPPPLVEINCNTDFTAKSEPFLKLGAEAAQALLHNPNVDIAAGRRSQRQRDRSRADRPARTSASARPPVVDAPAGGKAGLYLYGITGKIGVIMAFTGNPSDELIKQLGGHIAFARPVGLTRDEVPADLVAKETRVRRRAGQGHRQAAADRREDRRGQAERLLRRARPARPGVLQRPGLQGHDRELPQAERRRR